MRQLTLAVLAMLLASGCATFRRQAVPSQSDAANGGHRMPEDHPDGPGQSGQERVPAAEEAVTLPGRKFNAVHFNVASLFAGYLRIEYERVLLPELSIFVAPALWHPFWLPDEVAALQLTAGARWYPFSSAPTRFGVGVHATAGVLRRRLEFIDGTSRELIDGFGGSQLELLMHFALGEVIVLGVAMTGGFSHLPSQNQTIPAYGLRLSLGAQF